MRKIEDRLSKEDLDRVVQLYVSSDQSIQQICDEFNLGVRSFREMVKRLGIYRNRRSMSREEHIEAITQFDRVKLIGDWVDTKTPALYRCIMHGTEDYANPKYILRGSGLECCSQQAYQEAYLRQVEQSASDYDSRIREIHGDMIVRVDPYVGANVPVRHYCKKHDKTLEAQPSTILRGSGLACCRDASLRDIGLRRNQEARIKYKDRLKEISDNRYYALDEYIDARTAILHYCSLHDNEEIALPVYLLDGAKLSCCFGEPGWDTLENLLLGRSLNDDVDSETDYYIFRVPNFSDVFKLGISCNPFARAKLVGSKDLYGDFVASWTCSSRRNAILIETAVLRDPSFVHPHEILEPLVFKKGHGEVRRADEHDLISHIQDLYDSIEDKDVCWVHWAMSKIPSLTPTEKRILDDLSVSLSDGS